jgi:beta-glucosidase
VFMGYRWFDEKKIEPRFPFGHGISYTNFTYDDLKVVKMRDVIHVTCTIKNAGTRDGAEVVQVYVAPPKSSVLRPPRELKGFTKLSLKSGESKKVQIALRPSALTFYDEKSGKWKAEPGQYGILVGASSRDIRLHEELNLAETMLVDRF